MSNLNDDEVGLERLAAIVESSDDAIISKSLDGIIRSWNNGAEKIFGYSADEMIGQPITTIIPPDLQDEETLIISKLRAGEKIDHFDTVRLTKDGRRMDISLTVSPLRDSTGKIIGASKVARDVTDRKRAERLQNLLVDELNHRVKNMLATVQAIANQSLASAPSPQVFNDNFRGRLQALANAHDLLVKERMQGLLLKELIQTELKQHTDGTTEIDINGPRILLDSTLAVQMALTFHELTTNARKFGALSGPGGRVAVSWHRDPVDPELLNISWQETSSVPVRAPEHTGFGISLIEKSLKASGGRAIFKFEDTGLHVDLLVRAPEDPTPSVQAQMQGPEQFDDHNGAPAPALRGLKVLLVEDEVVVSMDMEFRLEELGCSVIGPAATVQEALDVLASNTSDIALVDANLGGERVDLVVETLASRGIPFAFSTGYGREALPSGFQDITILSKPFNDDQLSAVLKRLASNIKSQRPQLSAAD